MGVGIVVGVAVRDEVEATKVGVGVATGVGATKVGVGTTAEVGVMGALGVAVGPPHANPVIASAVIKEIKVRLFMYFAGVLISFCG